MKNNPYIISLLIFVICLVLFILLLMRLSFRKPVSKKEIPIKILKIIAIVSYLFICGLNAVSLPIFVLLLLCFIDFFQSFGFANLGISWESGSLAILTLATIYTYIKTKILKNKYLFILCFIALLLSIDFYTGVLKRDNFSYITFWFTIPLIIFVASSIAIIIISFVKLRTEKIK